MPQDHGASASGPRSHAPHEARAGLRPTGFDRSRKVVDVIGGVWLVIIVGALIYGVMGMGQ
jgi:hypothetical protein